LLLPGVTWLGVLRGPALMELAATVRATWMAAYARAADTNAEGRAATANLELRTHAAGADVRLQLTSLLLKLHESAAPSRAHAHLGLFWLRAFDRFRQENTPKVQPRANAHHGARLLPLSLPPFALVQQPVPVVSCHDICGKEDRSVMAMVAVFEEPSPHVVHARGVDLVRDHNLLRNEVIGVSSVLNHDLLRQPAEDVASRYKNKMFSGFKFNSRTV